MMYEGSPLHLSKYGINSHIPHEMSSKTWDVYGVLYSSLEESVVVIHRNMHKSAGHCIKWSITGKKCKYCIKSLIDNSSKLKCHGIRGCSGSSGTRKRWGLPVERYKDWLDESSKYGSLLYTMTILSNGILGIWKSLRTWVINALTIKS